jgi:hypothetical protein
VESSLCKDYPLSSATLNESVSKEENGGFVGLQNAMTTLTNRRLSRRALLQMAFLLASPAALFGQARCGVERWPVKIAADQDALAIDSIPVPTTVLELTRLPRPDGDLPHARRIAPTEFQTFLLRARLVRVIAEDDQDLHIVLRDLEVDEATIVVEIPSPDCTSDRRLQGLFLEARQALRGTPRNGIVEVVGIGFFDFLHGQSGMSLNGLELHPVLSLRVLRR